VKIIATFGAKSGLVHNTIMEAAQQVRYPIERWPNEFAREDADVRVTRAEDLLQEAACEAPRIQNVVEL
jgi:hypothetical protein